MRTKKHLKRANDPVSNLAHELITHLDHLNNIFPCDGSAIRMERHMGSTIKELRNKHQGKMVLRISGKPTDHYSHWDNMKRTFMTHKIEITIEELVSETVIEEEEYE